MPAVTLRLCLAGNAVPLTPRQPQASTGSRRPARAPFSATAGMSSARTCGAIIDEHDQSCLAPFRAWYCAPARSPTLKRVERSAWVVPLRGASSAVVQGGLACPRPLQAPHGWPPASSPLRDARTGPRPSRDSSHTGWPWCRPACSPPLAESLILRAWPRLRVIAPTSGLAMLPVPRDPAYGERYPLLITGPGKLFCTAQADATVYVPGYPRLMTAWPLYRLPGGSLGT